MLTARILGVVVAASVTLTACGTTTAPTILNTEKVERAIEQTALVQRDIHVSVSCPSGVRQRRGLSFTCTAIAGARITPFLVTELDGAGNVRYAAR